MVPAGFIFEIVMATGAAATVATAVANLVSTLRSSLKNDRAAEKTAPPTQLTIEDKEAGVTRIFMRQTTTARPSAGTASTATDAG
jgi:hypothetical protein